MLVVSATYPQRPPRPRHRLEYHLTFEHENDGMFDLLYEATFSKYFSFEQATFHCNNEEVLRRQSEKSKK
jgi:hypothetical protein